MGRRLFLRGGVGGGVPTLLLRGHRRVAIMRTWLLPHPRIACWARIRLAQACHHLEHGIGLALPLRVCSPHPRSVVAHGGLGVTDAVVVVTKLERKPEA